MSKHKSEEIAKLANELLTFYTAIMDDAIKTGDIVQLNLLAEQNKLAKEAKAKGEATNGEAPAAETKDGEEKKEAAEEKVQDKDNDKEPQNSAGKEKNTEATVEAPSETPKEEVQPQAGTTKSEDTPMTEAAEVVSY